MDLLRMYRFNSLSEKWIEGGVWLRNYVAALTEESVALAMQRQGRDVDVMEVESRDVFAESGADSMASRCTIL